MTATSFNAGWTVRPKVSIFEQLGGHGEEPSPVRLPHDALIGLERAPENSGRQGYFPGGVFEYAKTFDVPSAWSSKRVTVEFQGVHRDAVVYVNGSFAAQRPYGYSTFAVDLDPFLRYGEANIIRVDARAHEDSRWYTGAGIHRDTRLIVSDLVHIVRSGMRVTTPDVDFERAVVEVAVDVENEGVATSTVAVEVHLRDAGGHVVARGGAPVTLRAGAVAVTRVRAYVPEPALWNVDTPNLYTAEVEITGEGIVDRHVESFGIRTLRLDPTHGLRINGQTVKLRGACIHHDNGVLGAAAIGRAEERRVELLKDAGFNAIRAAHNPLSQAMLDACDRVGMLVMDETFDVWTESKNSYDYSLSFPEWWERDIEAMVTKDFNHPSVIFYSIGNEIPETGDPFGAEWSRRLAEKVRSLDSTRLVTNGINGFVSALSEVMGMMAQRRADVSEDDRNGSGGVNDLMNSAGEFMNRISASQLVTDKTAESFSVLDVAGMNYGDGRYALDSGLFPNRVIVGTETFPPHIAVNWKLVTELPHVIGDFTWTGFDYLGEVGIGRQQYADTVATFEAPYPWVTAWCGDLDITGFRRPASYYREIVFGLRADPYIAVERPEHFDRQVVPGQWAWTDAISSWTWDVATEERVRVEVYSDAEEVELVLNDESLGTRPAGSTHGFRAEFEVPYRPGELVAVASSGGVETGRFTLRSAEGASSLAVATDRESLFADDRDLAFVEIAIRDSAGTLVTSEARRVTVRVDGAGSLQALGSGRPDNAEAYVSPSHTTFDGRLLAIVRPNAVGPINVTVEAEGLATATVRLDALPAPAID